MIRRPIGSNAASELNLIICQIFGDRLADALCMLASGNKVAELWNN